MYGCFCHDTWYWLSYPLNCSFQWRFIARQNLVCINYLTNSNKSHSFFVDHCVKFIVQENLNPMLQKAFLFKGQIQKAFVVPFPPLQRKCPYFSEFLRQNDFFSCRKITGKVSKFKEYLDKSKEICVELRRFLNFKGERKQWLNYDDESEEWEFPPAKLSFPYT